MLLLLLLFHATLLHCLSPCSAVSWLYFEFRSAEKSLVMHMRGVAVEQCHTDTHFLRLWDGGTPSTTASTASAASLSTVSYRFRPVNGSDEVAMERFSDTQCDSHSLLSSSPVPRLALVRQLPRSSSAGNWAINSCAEDVLMNEWIVCLKIAAKYLPVIIAANPTFSENQYYGADTNTCKEFALPDLFSIYRSQTCLSASNTSSVRVDCVSIIAGAFTPTTIYSFNSSKHCEGESALGYSYSFCGLDDERSLSFDYDIFGNNDSRVVVMNDSNGTSNSNVSVVIDSESSTPSPPVLIRRYCGDGAKVNSWSTPTPMPTYSLTLHPTAQEYAWVYFSFAFTLTGLTDAQGVVANASLVLHDDWERLVSETVSQGRSRQSCVFLSAHVVHDNNPITNTNNDIDDTDNTARSFTKRNAMVESVRVYVNVTLNPIDFSSPSNASAVLAEASSLLRNISSSRAWRDFRTAAVSQCPQYFSANLSLKEPLLVLPSAYADSVAVGLPTLSPTLSFSSSEEEGEIEATSKKSSRKVAMPMIGVIVVSASVAVVCAQLVFSYMYCKRSSPPHCVATSRVDVDFVA